MEMKRQAIGWKNMPVNHIYDKRPEFIIHKELLKLKKKTNNPVFLMDKVFEHLFHKGRWQTNEKTFNITSHLENTNLNPSKIHLHTY